MIAAAQAEAERTRIEAGAQAEATRLAAEAEAAAILTKAEADAQVEDQFARQMELQRIEVSKVRAYGDRTIFVPPDGPGARMGNYLAIGMAASLGADDHRTT